MDFKSELLALGERFTVGGIIGGDLTPVLESERNFSERVVKEFKAFQIFSDSFCAFLLRSFEELSFQIQKNGWPEDRHFFQAVVLHFATAFKNFRATAIVSVKGYPFSGYSMLRDLLERAIFFSAVQNDVVGFESVCMGARSLALDRNGERESRKKRLADEKFAIDSTIGRKSGLQAEVVENLERWREMFHNEVHGAKYTHVLGHDKWISGKEPLSIGPEENIQATSLYAQNFCSVAWLWIRLLPSLQQPSTGFSDKWRDDWVAIDSVARGFVYGDGREMLKSIVEMTEAKFAFDPSTRYVF